MKNKMRKEIKAELIRFYEAPKPLRKQSFLQSVEQNMKQGIKQNIEPAPLNILHIFKVQLSYISKWTWLASIIFFTGALLTQHFFSEFFIGAILCMIPFLVMVSITESMRSVTYGMEELEQSARFSLKSVILARMGIMGTENMFLLLILAGIAGGEIWRMVLYILVPYLTTAYGSFYLVRKIRGREGVYACAALAALMCVFMTGGIYFYQWIFELKYISLWAALAAFFFGMTIKEGRNIIYKMEGILWN